MDVEAIQARLRTFVEARDWGQFHSPKNLSMALSGEAGELLELFQWLTEDQSHEIRQDPKAFPLVQQELADVLIYVLRLGDVFDIDLAAAVDQKITLNERKYPVDLAKGNATKYNRRDP